LDIQERFGHLDFVQEAVFVLNAAREIVFGNAVARGQFGEHRVGQDIVQHIRNPQWLGLLNDVIGGSPSAEKTIAFGAPANGAFHILVSRLPEIQAMDQLFLVSLRDVAEMQQAEEIRTDFVANVSHELRSPLSTISGFIETLKGAAKNDPVARDRFLNLMELEADRMERLIADLLSLSKIEALQRQRPQGQVDLVAIVEDVRTSLSMLANDLMQTIDIVAPHPIADIPGQYDELVQVVQNLLENGLKYSGPNSTITISVEVRTEATGFLGPVVSLQVRDDGEGIARQHLARLTERFYRVDAHRSRADGGTGLGLAIVKHIVQRHRGRLKIESDLGKGSTFTVLLPCE